jgi:hypothetical protein
VEISWTRSGEGDIGASTILERLGRVVAPDFIPVWLEKPIDLLARGELQPVLQVISGLESPGFS